MLSSKICSSYLTHAKMIKLIVACGLNGEIGKDNQLVWRNKEDLKHFRETTIGHHVVMGRKTWESMDCKALPKRGNIVITNTLKHKFQSFDDTTHNDYLSFIDLEAFMMNPLGAEEAFKGKPEDHLFVIGGSQLYEYFLKNNLVDEIILTGIQQKFPDADTHIDLEFIEDNFDKRHIVEYEGFDIITLSRRQS